MSRLFFCLLVVIALLTTACGGQATAVPFNTFTAQNVIDAMQDAGRDIQNVQRAMQIGRDAPATFSDRYTFEIGLIAPQGGQILVFNSDSDMQAWRDYIEHLRNDRTRRREVVYVYENHNIMLQLSSALPIDEANDFRDTFADIIAP
jgi:hypothetical protein